MCGIGGHVGWPRGPELRARMLAALRRRGPDAEHVATFDREGNPGDAAAPAAIGLVHARLSIIDPRPVADQPMGSADGRAWICYNGEVYGWEREARALESSGVRFRTRSDTEFMLHAYDAWGIDGLIERLTGMFAFALVDFRTRRVHLVRDRMGKKPLVYAHSEAGLAFGSTVRSVLPWLPRERREWSRAAIDAYLAHRYIPAPLTVLEGVARLPNAHRLEYAMDSGRFEIRRYWRPAPVPAPDASALFDDAIEKRLTADRPVGLFLSSGVDSTAIACRLAARGHAALHSFSAAFPGSALDESEEAAATARALGFPNERIVVPERIEDVFERVVADLDEPFADPSSFPTWFLSRETVRKVTVVLGGDGGDELFAGYKRIRKHLASRWRGRLAVPLPLFPSARSKGLRKLVAELSFTWEDAYALRFSGLTPSQRRFLCPDASATPPHYWRSPDIEARSPVERLLAWDFANYLPEYVLRKADLCTMAHGLELRAPFLDHRFVQSVLALPASRRFSEPPKRFLAQLAPELDTLGVFERKKRGFNPPVGAWLRGDLAARLPAAGSSLEDLTGGQLAGARVDALMAAYARAPGMGEQVLSLVMLEASLRQLRDLANGG